MSVKPVVIATFVGLLGLTGCAPDAPGPNDTHQDLLGSMMASESEINTIMGTTEVRTKTAMRSPVKNDNYEPISRPECIVSVGNAMDWVYKDSGYRQFREIQLSDDGYDVEVDQAITAFDNPKAARDLVAKTVDIWRRCGGDILTLTYDDGKSPRTRLLGVPSTVDGIDVTHDESTKHNSRTNSCRAIVAVDNMVVDLRVSGELVDLPKTVQLAKAIASRKAL